MNHNIYHITHIDNLSNIIELGKLLSDKETRTAKVNNQKIGFPRIKEMRLNKLLVKCHNNIFVGDCVPFNFCPRSVMLHRIHMKRADLNYQGGQESIIHLVADLNSVVKWADDNKALWAFSTSNAGAAYANFFKNLEELNQINWDAVNAAPYWVNCRDEKQAEFLLHNEFPWELVSSIGVHSEEILAQTRSILENADHKPLASVQTKWYYKQE